MKRNHGFRSSRQLLLYKICTVLIILGVLSTSTLLPFRAPVIAAMTPPIAHAGAPELQEPPLPPGPADEPPVENLEDEFSSPPAEVVYADVVERSAFSRVERNPDGTHTATFSQRPMHWYDSSAGAWREFDNTLRPVQAGDAAGDFAYENMAGNVRARFGKPEGIGAGRPTLQFETGGAVVSMAPRGAAPRDVVANGAQITYTNAYRDVDLRYTVDNELVKEDIFLKAVPTAPARFTFDLTLQGVTAVLQPDNSINFVDAGGTTLLVMPSPYMMDS
ncbi:MAG TPA: hypothetical protein VF707_21015, partial [Ardenticatenaceae bacterium]